MIDYLKLNHVTAVWGCSGKVEFQTWFCLFVCLYTWFFILALAFISKCYPFFMNIPISPNNSQNGKLLFSIKCQLGIINFEELAPHFSTFQSFGGFFSKCISFLFELYSNCWSSCSIQRSPHSHSECFCEPANFENAMPHDIFFKSTMICCISVLETVFLTFHCSESAQQISMLDKFERYALRPLLIW